MIKSSSIMAELEPVKGPAHISSDCHLQRVFESAYSMGATDYIAEGESAVTQYRLTESVLPRILSQASETDVTDPSSKKVPPKVKTPKVNLTSASTTKQGKKFAQQLVIFKTSALSFGLTIVTVSVYFAVSFIKVSNP